MNTSRSFSSSLLWLLSICTHVHTSVILLMLVWWATLLWYPPIAIFFSFLYYYYFFSFFSFRILMTLRKLVFLASFFLQNKSDHFLLASKYFMKIIFLSRNPDDIQSFRGNLAAVIVMWEMRENNGMNFIKLYENLTLKWFFL
jgi:hypothetical protein